MTRLINAGPTAIFVSLSLLPCPAPNAAGQTGMTQFTDRNSWFESASGEITTLAFTHFEFLEVVTDQYLELGALFVDGNDYVWFAPNAFEQDGWGLGSETTPIIIQFCEPQRFVGIDFPGSLVISLRYEGLSLGSTSLLCCSPGDGAEFGGVITAMPFDEIIIWDTPHPVFADDIHFGRFPPVVGDTTFDGVVNINDLLDVITNWGECNVPEGACPVPPCAHADLNEDGRVDVNDLVEVLINWTARGGEMR